jgi:hypothetical protein
MRTPVRLCYNASMNGKRTDQSGSDGGRGVGNHPHSVGSAGHSRSPGSGDRPFCNGTPRSLDNRPQSATSDQVTLGSFLV